MSRDIEPAVRWRPPTGWRRGTRTFIITVTISTVLAVALIRHERTGHEVVKTPTLVVTQTPTATATP